MSNDLVITKMTETGHPIRRFDIPGKGTWYLAKDVTDILGYAESNSSHAIKTNCENGIRLCDMKALVPGYDWNEIKDLGLHPQALLIQRPDVHRLIVAAKRTKEEAAQFEKWIFEDVLEEVFDKGSYSLPNNNTTNTNLENIRVDKLLQIIEETNSNMRLMSMQHAENTKLILDQNSKMLDCISNFNDMLALSKFQTAVNTAFTLNEYIDFEKYVEFIKEMADVKIRANFNSVNLRIYLFKNVNENERIFKSTGEPYEKYISGGFYKVEKSETSKVFITKVGAEHLYWFLKAKKILN